MSLNDVRRDVDPRVVEHADGRVDDSTDRPQVEQCSTASGRRTGDADDQRNDQQRDLELGEVAEIGARGQERWVRAEERLLLDVRPVREFQVRRKHQRQQCRQQEAARRQH